MSFVLGHICSDDTSCTSGSLTCDDPWTVTRSHNRAVTNARPRLPQSGPGTSDTSEPSSPATSRDSRILK
eukprot:4792266-Amphidinium_carterae.1